MADNIKTAVTLFLITLISGFLLGGVYAITKEPIAAANQAALYAAYETLVPGGAEYEELPEAAEKANADLADGRFGNVTVNNVVRPVDAAGEPLGYIVDVTSHDGYGGDIQITVGYTGEVRWDTSRPNGTPRKLLDVSKAASLGWRYRTELEDGIRLAYADFLHNPVRAER